MAPTDALMSPRPFIALTHQSFEQTTSAGWVDRLTMKVSSSQEAEKYRWLGGIGGMEEFVSAPRFQGVGQHEYEIKNIAYQNGIMVKKEEWRRESTGQLQQRFRELGTSAAIWPQEKTSEIIQAGETVIGFDGKALFATDHPSTTKAGASTTQSNIVTVDISTLPTSQHGTITDPAPQEFVKALMKAVQRHKSFTDIDNGRPVGQGTNAFDVMVPVGLLPAALEAMQLQVFAGGETNVINSQSMFTFNPIVNSELTWTDQFAVFAADNASVKPLIWQEEQSLQSYSTTPGDKEWSFERRVRASVDYVGNIQPGRWQGAILVKLT